MNRKIESFEPIFMHDSFPGVMFQAGDRIQQTIDDVVLVRNHRHENVYFLRSTPSKTQGELAVASFSFINQGSMAARDDVYKTSQTYTEPVIGRHFGSLVGHVEEFDGQPFAVGPDRLLDIQNYNDIMDKGNGFNGSGSGSESSLANKAILRMESLEFAENCSNQAKSAPHYR